MGLTRKNAPKLKTLVLSLMATLFAPCFDGCGSSSNDDNLDGGSDPSTENQSDSIEDASADSLDVDEGEDVDWETVGDQWESLPSGCEHVFPESSVRCESYDCPIQWRYCCGSYLCGDMSEYTRGCCNDYTCGTGGEPLTYDCVESIGNSLKVECGYVGTENCPSDKPRCCVIGNIYVCADHELEGWRCELWI